MSLRVTDVELLASLTARVATFAAGPYRVGLFQNDVVLSLVNTMADLVVCNFGGYVGELPLNAWGAVVWSSPRASCTHAAKVWTGDGSSTNVVHGYYVVDPTGTLRWLEKRATGGVVVGLFNGHTYTCFPVYTRKSEF